MNDRTSRDGVMNDRTVEKAIGLFRRWGLADSAYAASSEQHTAEVVLDGDAGYLEHLIHEMAHAKLLGLDWGPGMSDSIGRLLVDDVEKAIEEEAKAWAAEWAAFRYLGYVHEPQRDSDLLWLDDVFEHAGIQGVSSDIVESYLEDESCVEVGACIAEFLRPGATTEAETLLLPF